MSLLVEPNLVSTIIPVFNRPDLIVEAVQSVLGQTHRPIEIIIVDDGSTDHTPEVLRSLQTDHSEIKVFRQENAGPGTARELGRLNLRGEFVQYLDSDDVLLPLKFEQQIAALALNNKADVAYGKTEVVQLGNKPRQRAGRNTGMRHDTMFPLMIRERWWYTSTPLYRRQVLEQAGPWTSMNNEEDWEYDCRVAALGGVLAYVDEFVSLHRVHDNHLSHNGASSPDKLRNRALSRAKIFQHAKGYMQCETRPNDIEDEDWRVFSKYAFLLARQCALAGLSIEARAMTSVSIEAVGKKTPQHIVFLKLVKLLGWQRAAKTVKKFGR